MNTEAKHYRFINSQTGNTIYYFTLEGTPTEDEARAQLDKIKAQVAINNSLFLEIVYWEEVKGDQAKPNL